MRIYLNLTNRYEHLKDDEGLEVENYQTARAEVMRSLKELRQEASYSSEWEGWELHVVNDIGALLFSVDLSCGACESVCRAASHHMAPND